ncbi:MAG: mandelate racemase/muconate lactonizing enzyme family protein [Halanaerobiales bacterium]
MQIKDIKYYNLSIPLKKPFQTSLRTVKSAEETIIKIITDTGEVGIGEAPPTAVITGETGASIKKIIAEYLFPLIKDKNIENHESILQIIDNAVLKNSSAKAAVDMAVYDLYGKLYNAPLYRLLGGYREVLETDITVSIDSPEIMQQDARKAVEEGYNTLKLKVGKDIETDIKRTAAVRKVVGKDIKIRLDANQGWSPKEAVKVIKKMEKMDLNIELVEQPVAAADFAGLKFVRERVLTPIMADESLFSPEDCFRLFKMKACDLINIKLMKTGGIRKALMINAMAEAVGIEVMLGSMLEAKVSVTAAAQLAAARKNITRLDLDAPILLAEDPVKGGIRINGPRILLPQAPGLGIKKINNLDQISSI